MAKQKGVARGGTDGGYKKTAIKLARGEHVIAVVPETCSGPGWSNRIVRVYIASTDNRLRTEYLQPEETPRDLALMFRIGETVCAQMIDIALRDVVQATG